MILIYDLPLQNPYKPVSSMECHKGFWTLLISIQCFLVPSLLDLFHVTYFQVPAVLPNAFHPPLKKIQEVTFPTSFFLLHQKCKKCKPPPNFFFGKKKHLGLKSIYVGVKHLGIGIKPTNSTSPSFLPNRNRPPKTSTLALPPVAFNSERSSELQVPSPKGFSLLEKVSLPWDSNHH